MRSARCARRRSSPPSPILSLALGIGANTAIFSHRQRRDAARAAGQGAAAARAGHDRADADVVEQPVVGRAARARPPAVRRRLRLLDAALQPRRAAARSSRRSGIMASGGFFDVLGVPAILGRTFTPRQRRPQGRRASSDRQVAVISYDFWQRQYGGAADVLGKTVELDLVPFTIIGVTPPELHRRRPGHRLRRRHPARPRSR